jgi:DNA-binding NarL/FixJ family response regulator
MGIEDKQAIFEKLTPRQVEVFNLVGEGKTSGGDCRRAGDL